MTATVRPSREEAEEIGAFLEAAGVPAGARVLDVPCGVGRRARTLAERGFRMTAVDANPVAIEGLSRRIPQDLRGRLECRSAPKATMPGLPPGERFDAILSLDHPVGRGDRAEDVAFLERLRGHASPNGLLVLDLLHRDFFAARPRPFAYHVIGGIEQHEFRAFDPVSGILDLTWKFYRQEGESLRFQGASSARLRLLSPHETGRLLEDAGWSVAACYGSWEKEVVSADRRKFILVARVAARS